MNAVPIGDAARHDKVSGGFYYGLQQLRQTEHFLLVDSHHHRRHRRMAELRTLLRRLLRRRRLWRRQLWRLRICSCERLQFLPGILIEKNLSGNGGK